MRKIVTIAFLTLCTSGFAQTTLFDSLQACYPLHGNANDMEHGMNGTVGAVTPADDRLGNSSSCYNFDGTVSSIITIPENPRLKGQAMTISAWVYPTALSGCYVVLTKNQNSAYWEAYSLSLSQNDFKWTAVKANAMSHFYAFSASSPVINTWYHIVETVDQNGLKLYVNGQVESSVNAPGAIEYKSGDPICIGSSNVPSLPAAFKGRIDNVTFYNRVLTGAEVRQLYQSDAECLSVGVSEELIESVRCYPNPSTGALSFTGLHVKSDVTLFDMLGNEVIRSVIDGAESLDISDLPNGVYFVLLKSGDKTNFTKLIKQ
jgi:hypothetical protein